MGNEQPAALVADRLAQPGRVGRESGCPAGRRLDVGDTPPFLRRRIDGGPGAAQQGHLLIFGYEAQEIHCPGRRASRALTQGPLMVALPRHNEARVDPAGSQPGGRIDHALQPLIPLEPTDVRERRVRETLARWIGCVALVFDPRIDDLYTRSWYAARGQVVGGRLRYRLEGHAAINAGQRPLR